MGKMGEKRIRQALVSLLRAKHADSPDMLVRHEMELLGQWNRVDVCTLLDDFHGYEIKSAADNLKRLPRQATAYGRVFDKVTAVVSPSHFDEVTAIVPHWWGITVAVERENHPLTLAEVRESQRNPSLDPFWLAGMLWRTQLDELTRELGLKVKYQAEADQTGTTPEPHCRDSIAPTARGRAHETETAYVGSGNSNALCDQQMGVRH